MAMMVPIQNPLAKKLSKARKKLLAAADPDERAHLQKRLKKLERVVNAPAPTPGRVIPKEAFQLRHKWVK